MLKRVCLSFMGGGGNSQKERGNNNFNIITQMLGNFVAQLIFSFFLYIMYLIYFLYIFLGLYISDPFTIRVT